MTTQNTTNGSAVHFSARKLTALFGSGDALCNVLERDFAVRANRGAVLGWVQRDQIPGWVIAQMMVSRPDFPVRELIAEKAPAKRKAPEGNPDLAALLS